MPRLIETESAGNCYEASLQILLENPAGKLVHGHPRLSAGEHEGEKFGHAWVEVEVLGTLWCLDYQKLEAIPAALYYFAGRIESDDCKRYTFAQARRNALRSGHSGPWGKQSKDTLFAIRKPEDGKRKTNRHDQADGTKHGLPALRKKSERGINRQRKSASRS